MNQGLRCLFILLVMRVPGLTQTRLDTSGFRLSLDSQARWVSLTDRRSGRELCAPSAKLPFAAVRVAGRSVVATKLRYADRRLEVAFGASGTRLVYRVERTPDWLRLTLERVAGPRPERVTLMQVPVAIVENVGRRLDIAWDANTSVCLLAGNEQTGGGAARRKGYALLRATTQDGPGPRLEGASAALIVCPTKRIRAVLRTASHTFGLLTNEKDGVPAKETPAAGESYWFMTLGENDADRMIDYCRRAGIRQVMIGSNSWCRSVGHYLFNKQRFPHGEAGLKQLVDRLHAAGILVGMHTFVSKVSKIDPYVTPVPDRRFWVDRKSTLAETVSSAQTEVRCTTSLKDWPGSPVAAQKLWEGGVAKHREVILDDEIIQYESIGPPGRWDTFQGCRRGAWGTHAARHDAGAGARHYGVDGCINGYIIDQETDLLDEVTTRIAGIFNRCGFDMVYFDGGEDVPRTRFNYYVTRFQAAAMRRFTKRPIIHMGTIMTHRLWHSFARRGTVDTYLNTLHGALIAGRRIDQWPTVRSHIDHSVQRVLSCRQDLLPGELGWFGIWPRGRNTDGLQLDEAEYLMVKSLAYDAPISLQTSFAQMESHPLTPQILEIVKAYESLRRSHQVSAKQRERLKEPGKDFILVQRDGTPEFIAVRSVPTVGGGREVRALVGKGKTGAIATMWHHAKDGVVEFRYDPARLYVTDFSGRSVPFTRSAGKCVIPVDSRRLTLFFAGSGPEEVAALLEAAQVKTRPVTYLWLQAEGFLQLRGKMALGSRVGVVENEAFGDVLVCTGRPSRQQPPAWYAEYRTTIPHAGQWSLWARVRYPSGVDDSFGVVWSGEPVTLSGNQVLGNCGVNHAKWHWTGRGSGTTTVPPGSAITKRLPKGPVTFRIYAREGPGVVARNPRLDVLCLTDDPAAVPTDELAKKAPALRRHPRNRSKRP